MLTPLTLQNLNFKVPVLICLRGLFLYETFNCCFTLYIFSFSIKPTKIPKRIQATNDKKNILRMKNVKYVGFFKQF